MRAHPLEHIGKQGIDCKHCKSRHRVDNLIDEFNPDAHADGMTQEEFTESMRDLHREFEQLNNEAAELSSSITDKLKELVL